MDDKTWLIDLFIALAYLWIAGVGVLGWTLYLGIRATFAKLWGDKEQ